MNTSAAEQKEETMHKYTEAQRKALDIGKSISVTAGAGTGKTFLLTQRYIRLLESGARPKDITALTYTEKAAAEMQTKIAREIKMQAKTNPQMQEALDTFSQASISTFHGFCLSILKEFAYEAGLEPGFSIMDDLDKTELIENSIKDVLKNPGDELFETVVRLHLYMNPQEITKAVKRIIETGDAAWFETLRTDPETVRQSWLAACRDHFELSDEFVECIENAPESEYLFALKQLFLNDPVNSGLLNRLEQNPKHQTQGRKSYWKLRNRLKEAKTPDEIRIAGADYGTSSVDEKKDFPVSLEEKTRTAEFINLFKVLPFIPGKDSFLFSQSRKLLLDLFDTAAVCEQKIRYKKQKKGLLDFNDLIQITDELVSEKHPEILETVSRRCRYVLVDEVQDNDPTLVGLLRKLCGNIKENDRLFIVGDAKQSIYLFRGADSTVYQDFQNDFGENRTALDTSFRSAPEIIQFVNELFSKIFTGSGYDPVYDEIKANRMTAKGSIEVINLPNNQETGVETEAETLASWIFDRIENQKLPIVGDDGTSRAAEYADVAILLRSRKNLPHLCAALEKYHIPFTEEGGKSLYARQETKDLYNLLCAVLYPEDDIPLYGALRSPYFAVPDAELEKAAFGKTGTLFSRLQQFADEQSRTADALRTLARWREYAKHLTPSAVLESIISESEILAVYAGHPAGDRMEGNLMKLADIAREKSTSRPYSLYEFAEFLEQSMEFGVETAEGEPLEERGGRVRILTVHASKGLEYPVVCLCFAGNPSEEDDKDSLVFDDVLGAGVRVRLPGLDTGINPVRNVRKQVRDEKQAAERKRLFYVALTRARDHLVLCGTQQTKEGHSKKSFLYLYESEKKELSQNPAVLDTLCCLPRKADRKVSYVSDAVCVVPDCAGEPVVTVSREAASAMQRGSRLHAVFAGDSVDAEFSGQYQAFLDSELMQNVVFECCEMPVVCGTKRRVIDRFVQYADGTYAVIDYKTGSLAAAKKQGLFEQYVEQVSVYAGMMQEMTGGVVSGWLYFADEKEGERIIPVR